MFTQFSEEPINYKGKDGKWKEIDRKLVAQANGRGFHNAAGPVQIELPKSLSSRPARVESNGNFVEFTLKGAKKGSSTKPKEAPVETPATSDSEDQAVAQPSPTSSPSTDPATATDGAATESDGAHKASPPPNGPAPTNDEVPPQATSGAFTIAAVTSPGQQNAELLVAPSDESAEVEGESATYSEVFEGVDIVYSSLGRGLKEEIVLAGPDAPLSYDFTLRLNAGSRAVPSDSGGIDLIDGSGAIWAQIARPFAYDATVADRSPAEGMNLNDVKLELVSDGAATVIRLAVAESWILDPSRNFPVVLDPSVILPGAYQTTTTPSAPNDNFAGLGWTAIYGYSAPWRALAKPQADLASFFKEPVEVISAAFDMGLLIDSTGQPAYPVGAYEVTSRWYNTTATWNQRTPGVNWGAPGGDIAAQPAAVNANVTGGTLGAKTWWITDLVKDWVNGTKAYNGLMVRYINEAQPGPVIYFDNSKTSMTIWWLPRTETADPYPHASFNLGERRTAAVSLGAGSVEVRETDVSLSGVAGMDLAITRHYSSRGGYTNGLLGWGTGMGWGWSLEVPRLTAFADGGAMITGMPEGTLHFTRTSPSTYRSPKAFRGELAPWVNGAYLLTMHDTGAQMVFGSTGHLAWIWDRNKNQNDLQNPNDNQWIMFNYTYSQYLADYLLTSITDTRGQVTQIIRPAVDRPISKIVDPFGRTHQYGYSGDASTGYRMTSYTDPAGKVTHYDYMTVPPGHPGPQLNKITDQVGNQTRISYTQAPSLIGPVPTGGMQTAGTTYRATSLVRVTDNSAGTGPTYGIGYLGRTTSTDPAKAYQTKVTDPNGHASDYFFEKSGLLREVVDPAGKSVKASYNDRGFVVSQTDQAGKTTVFIYNSSNPDNLEKLTTPVGVEKGTAFGHGSFKYYPTSATNAQGNQLIFGYDAMGNTNMRRNQLAAQNEALAFYNPNGTVDHTVDGVGNITRHHYYSNTNLQCISGPPAFGQSAPSSPPPSCPGLPPGSQVRQSFTYDNLHRVSTVTDAEGNVTTYAYDALDRVTRTDFAPGGSYIVNVYDNAGRLTSVQDHSGPGPTDPFTTASYTYDALNRQKTKTAAGVTFTSTYDAAGNLKSLADPGGTVTYDYSPVNLLNWVRDPAGAQTNFEYDAAYRRSAVHYPNGVTQTTTYDDDGKVKTITGTKSGGTVLTSFEYDYVNPANGKQTELVFKATEPSGVTTYKYDQVDRLKEATGPTGTYLYEYDGNSNRTEQTINGVDSFFAVDAADQLCHQAAVQVACGSAPAGSTTFSYDANGNLTGQSDGRVLTYNAKDQNTSFKAAGGATSSMGYFGTGQAERTGAAGATFTNGPLGVASSSVLLLNTSYVRDPSGTLVSQKGLLSTHYYLFDRLGSVVALTDGSGNAVNRYVYEPYGNRLAGTVEAVANPWQFAGGFRDAFSGYTKFGERYYDPSIGRWTQRDPSGMDANSYGYAGANPVNFVDLTGLAARWAEKISTGLGLVAAGAQYLTPVCPHCAVGARAFSAVWDAGIVGYDCAIARRGCRESATRFAVNQAAGFGFGQVAKFRVDKTLAGAQEISNRAEVVAGLTQTAVGESMNLADRWT